MSGWGDWTQVLPLLHQLPVGRRVCAYWRCPYISLILALVGFLVLGMRELSFEM